MKKPPPRLLRRPVVLQDEESLLAAQVTALETIAEVLDRMPDIYDKVAMRS